MRGGAANALGLRERLGGGLPLHPHSSPGSRGAERLSCPNGTRANSELPQVNKVQSRRANPHCSPDRTLWVSGGQLPRGRMRKEEQGRAGRNCL